MPLADFHTRKSGRTLGGSIVPSLCLSLVSVDTQLKTELTGDFSSAYSAKFQVDVHGWQLATGEITSERPVTICQSSGFPSMHAKCENSRSVYAHVSDH